MQKDWLKNNFNLAVDLLPAEPVIIEIGSHAGNGVTYIKKMRPKAKIYAIEPYKKNYIKLKKHHERSYNLAITDQNKNMRLAKIGSSRQYRLSKNGDEKVEQITLDEFIEKNDIKGIDLLRFDCYGSEYKIFAAPRRFLDVSDMVCITMHKKKVCKEVDVQVERNFIRACLMNAGFELMCSYGKGEKKHIFQLWKKAPRT